MSAVQYLTVRNFEKFQHYKDRATPSWIKLYSALLHDYDFQQLPDESKAHLMLIWLLVSQRNDRRIPNDPKWVASQIGARGRVDLQILIDTSYLIPLEEAYQTARASVPTNESSGSGSVPRSNILSSDLISSPLLSKNHKKRAWPDDLALTAEMREYARQAGINADGEFRAWHDDCLANGRSYSDWQAAWRTRINNAPKFAARKPIQNSQTTMDMAKRWANGNGAGKENRADAGGVLRHVETDRGDAEPVPKPDTAV